MQGNIATRNAEVAADAIRRATHEGRDHLVAPVVAVREMVLKGELLPADEIAASEPAWNGRVLPIGHPTDGEGNFASANSPDVHDAKSVGTFFGADADDGKLTGEVWVDVEKSKRLAAEHNDDRFVKPLAILASHAEGVEAANITDDMPPALQANAEEGDVLEVSTAYFYNRRDAIGNHDGKQYEATQHDIRPDHLALLPNSEGECSAADGCGAPRVHVHANVSANKSTAGVSFTGTAGGTLDEAALDPEEHTLSDHYLYGEGEDKEDFSYPVVDAGGDLRRGNVTSAWELGCRGQCPGDETHRENVRSLAREFDSVPEFAQENGRQTNYGVTPDGEQEPLSNYGSTDMNDNIEWLASHTKFDAETLEGFEDSHLETLKASVEAAGEHDDCGCNDSTGNEEQDPEQNSGDDGDELPQAVQERLESLTTEVEDLREQVNADREAERESHIDTITSNSERFDTETLEGMDTEALAALADEVSAPNAADFGGRVGANGSPSSNGDDADDYRGIAKAMNASRFGDPAEEAE